MHIIARINADNIVFNSSISTDYKKISCANATDQFATSNNKAELRYPIGLMEEAEKENIADYTLLKTGVGYWTISPDYFSNINSVRAVGENGNPAPYTSTSTNHLNGIRPVVSLASFVPITSGTGSETDPWIVE